MAVPSGFEPKLAGPKPAVLPLHHGTIFINLILFRFIIFF